MFEPTIPAKAIAHQFHCHPETAHKVMKEEKVRYVKEGREKRYYLADVVEVFKRRTRR